LQAYILLIRAAESAVVRDRKIMKEFKYILVHRSWQKIDVRVKANIMYA